MIRSSDYVHSAEELGEYSLTPEQTVIAFTYLQRDGVVVIDFMEDGSVAVSEYEGDYFEH